MPLRDKGQIAKRGETKLSRSAIQDVIKPFANLGSLHRRKRKRGEGNDMKQRWSGVQLQRDHSCLFRNSMFVRGDSGHEKKAVTNVMMLNVIIIPIPIRLQCAEVVAPYT